MRVDGPVKTAVKEGDSYVDVPIYGEVPVYCAKEPMTAKTLRYYRREPLRWLRPVRNGIGEIVRNRDGSIKMEPR